MSQFDELPEGWIKTTLKEIVLTIQYGYTASAREDHVGPRLLRITDLQRNSVDWDVVPFCECDDVEKYSLKKGDIVIARTGATTGKSFLLDDLPEETIFASYLIRLSTSEVFPPEYVGLFLQSPAYWDQIIVVSKGTAQPGANAKILSGLNIPLPPVNEQRRIVEKIEALTARSRKARAVLDEIPALLDQFRQSVLAAAFRGDLTADWHAQNPNVELANRITTSNELLEVVIDDLPESWTWIDIHNIGDVKGGKRLPKGEKLVDYDTGFPYIKAGDLKNGTVLLENIQYISRDIHDQIRRYVVEAGDVYITIVGACIGDAGIIPKTLEGANLTENAAKICHLSGVNNQYLALWLRSPLCQKIIQRKILSAAQGKLALARIKQIPVPLAPEEEQLAVVHAVEKFLDFANCIEQQFQSLFPDTDQLDRTILAKAFRGELVPQDPNDEPAAVLLDRIRAERERLGSGKKRGKAKG